MLTFKDGKMALPEAPGLRVEIDPDKLARLAENVARARSRDDLLKQWDPSFPTNGRSVRW
jgi:hypothetical protein